MSWRSIDPLPAARWNLAVASHRNWIYVAGGATDFAMTTAPLSILKSRIEPEGGKGANSPWVSCAPDMTTGKIGATLLAVHGNLMLIGGRGVDILEADISPAQDIHVGKLDSDGNVPRWIHLAGVLPARLTDAAAVVHGEHLYVLGGLEVKAILLFENQVGNFTAGQTVTGLTSGATAVIDSDVDGGATGTLTISTVTGVFQNGETVTDPLGGSATLTGLIVKKLSYKSQTVNFTASQVVQGITSGSTATRVSDMDNGATGTLTVNAVTGLYTDSEPLAVAHARANQVFVPAPVDSFYLDYDTQTGAFTVGQVVTGAGGAIGTISADQDDGVTGTLTLTGVVGNFIDGEAITDPITGVAKVAAGTVKYKTLAYTAQTTNFAASQVIWGLTSGHTGTIMSDADGGATGTLKVKLVTGTFTHNENIGVQYALADGTLVQTIPYGSQTGNFTVGDTVTGDTSNATATIYQVNDVGATGSLILTDVVGVFQNAELLTGALGGSATADGVIDFYNTSQDAAYRARLGPDGSVGEFETLPTVLPVVGDIGGVCAVVGNHLFISDDVSLHMATIGPDGIGPWSAAAPNFVKTGHQLIKMPGEKLLAVGGYDGANTVGSVFSATINSSGEANPAAWRQTGPMPTEKDVFGLTRIGNRLFAIGGLDDANAVQTEVYSAQVEPSGKIGGY